MSETPNYPFSTHPCYSATREGLWARIHLPVAPVCNVKCIFCTHGVGSACHSSKPGFSSQTMSVEDAISVLQRELEMSSNLRIAAVSGPGEPLANSQTLELLTKIRQRKFDVELCLSTNGTLLEENASSLAGLGITTISVSMSAVNPAIASQIYEWAVLDGKRYSGTRMSENIVKRQLNGIHAASKAGLIVKVNTVLIPGINDGEMADVADAASKAGARLQNIVPLVPAGRLVNHRRPSSGDLAGARSAASKYISQFTHCKQCRSDVVGIPGNDRIL